MCHGWECCGRLLRVALSGTSLWLTWRQLSPPSPRRQPRGRQRLREKLGGESGKANLDEAFDTRRQRQARSANFSLAVSFPLGGSKGASNRLEAAARNLLLRFRDKKTERKKNPSFQNLKKYRNTAFLRQVKLLVHPSGSHS